MNKEQYKKQVDDNYLLQIITEEFYYQIAINDIADNKFSIWHNLPKETKTEITNRVNELRTYIKNNCMTSELKE